MGKPAKLGVIGIQQATYGLPGGEPDGLHTRLKTNHDSHINENDLPASGGCVSLCVGHAGVEWRALHKLCVIVFILLRAYFASLIFILRIKKCNFLTKWAGICT